MSLEGAVQARTYLAKCHIIEKHILRLNNVVGSQKKRLVAQH